MNYNLFDFRMDFEDKTDSVQLKSASATRRTTTVCFALLLGHAVVLIKTAHFDGEKVQFDEPCRLDTNARLMVVLPPNEECHDWSRFSAGQLAKASGDMGIEVEGLSDVLVRLAKCCKPVPGDAILGYISLGRGITIHRDDCPNARALLKNPERFTPVSWGGANRHGFRVEIAIDAWDRPRLLEDLSRSFAESGVNIVSANCHMENQMVHDRFVVDVGDIESLKGVVSQLRNVESVFDAYRVTPG